MSALLLSRLDRARVPSQVTILHLPPSGLFPRCSPSFLESGVTEICHNNPAKDLLVLREDYFVHIKV